VQSGAAAYFSTRPRQVSAVLDALLNDPQWKDRIARDAQGPKIGALGHSVRAIHLSDNDQRSDLHLLPGDGDNITGDLASILTELEYTGVITYEISPLRYSLRDVLDHITAEVACSAGVP
jgi:hypothetical protein